VSFEIKDIDRTAGLIAELTVLNAATVKVGVLGDSPKNARHGEEGHATNALIAAAHEFGTDDIPRRPFLAPALDKGAKKITDAQAEMIGKVLDGTMLAEQALGLLGELGVSLVKAEIRSGPPPPLEPSTVAAKGSSHPLIDSGQMLASVTYKIVRVGGGDG
jgi:hypothetical protein